MRRVAQKDKIGCGLACIASIAGASYSDVKKKVFGKGCVKYMDSKHIRDGLRAFHVKAGKRFIPLRSQHYRTLPFDALLKVNVRDSDENWHWVVWYKKGGKVIDPQRVTGGRYRAVSYLRVWPLT